MKPNTSPRGPISNPIDRTQELDNVWLYAGNSEHDEEFSWQRCDCCNSSLGGSRHHVVGLNKDDTKLPVLTYMVCLDCYEGVAA